MKLGELASILFNNNCIKVKSAYDGKMLINSYSESKHKKFDELTITNAYTTLRLNDRITEIGSTASAVIVCYAREEEYRRLKEAEL